MKANTVRNFITSQKVVRHFYLQSDRFLSYRRTEVCKEAAIFEFQYQFLDTRSQF